MKRILLVASLTFLVGLSLGLFFSSLFPKPVTLSPLQNSLTAQTSLNNNARPVVTPSSVSGEKSEEPENAALLELSYQLLEAMKSGDYGTLAAHVSSLGLRLTPYSTVDVDEDVVLSAAQVAAAAGDAALYHWGYTDGEGAPISLTITDYFDAYVFNADYTEAPRIGIDTVCQSGNALENVAEAYPGARFVEFHFPGLEPKNEGLDWCSLKLVFLRENGQWRLEGLIHSQWTI